MSDSESELPADSLRLTESLSLLCPFTAVRTRMEDDENQLTPCITDDGYTFLYVKHNNLFCQSRTRTHSHQASPTLPVNCTLGVYLHLLSLFVVPRMCVCLCVFVVMAMSKRNANAMIVMNFLYRIVEVFEDYFTELVEESIRDNFVITYELLDEMMDFGYPQSTESKVLKESVPHTLGIHPHCAFSFRN